MWRKDTLAIAVSNTSMNEEMAMTVAMSHGLRLPAAERSGDQPPWLSAISPHRDFRDHGHAWTQRAAAGHAVEYNLHRHPLHDLDVVAGCVFRRQQSERLPGSALN